MKTRIKQVGKISVNVVTDKRESLLSNHLITESDAEMDSRATAAVKSALDRAKVCKKPVAKYDTVTKHRVILIMKSACLKCCSKLTVPPRRQLLKWV